MDERMTITQHDVTLFDPIPKIEGYKPFFVARNAAKRTAKITYKRAG